MLYTFFDAPHWFGIRGARMFRQGSERVITKMMQHIREMYRTFFVDNFMLIIVTSTDFALKSFLSEI